MSEYIEITTEDGEDNDSIYILTNLLLTEGEIEEYASQEAMEFGSPVAQALSAVTGLHFVRLQNSEIYVRREPGADWYAIIEDITAVLKDFFL
jgi:hypothetical protein